MKYLHRKPDGCLSHQPLPPSQGARRACGCQNTRLGLGFTSAPVQLLFPHLPEWLPWWECFPRMPWLSKVFEDTQVLKSSTSSASAHVSQGAEPEEQHVYGIAANSGCDTGRTQRFCSPQIKATSLCDTCTHITTTLKGQLKWPVKNCVFSSYRNCSYYMKKKKKKVKNFTFLSNKVENNGSCFGKSKKESNGSHAAQREQNLPPQLWTALHLAPHTYYLFFIILLLLLLHSRIIISLLISACNSSGNSTTKFLLFSSHLVLSFSSNFKYFIFALPFFIFLKGEVINRCPIAFKSPSQQALCSCTVSQWGKMS